MSTESSGKPDAWKLARPVWGWGRGETPRPTPLAVTSGAINDMLKASGSSAQLDSPITSFPDFERLEFKGRKNHKYLGPFLKAMKQLADQQREAKQ